MLASMVFLSAMNSTAQEFTLTETQLEGSERYSAEEFFESAQLKVGDLVTIAILEQAAQRMSRLGLFTSVRFDYHTLQGNIRVTFRVADAGLMRPLKFDNFIWFSDEELLAQLAERVPMFAGTAPTSGGQIEKITLALDRVLTERGIHGAVQYMPGFPYRGAPVETMWHEFSVSGVEIPVAAIRFTGTEKFPVTVLDAEAQRLVGRNFVGPVLEGFAAKQILPLFHRRGMLRAAVSPPALTLLEPVEDTFPVEVTFHIEEGPVFTVRAIEWEGVTAASLREVTKHITLKPGSAANVLQLGDDLKKLVKNLYRRRGYLDASASYVPAIDDAAHEITLIIKLTEGDQFEFEQVIFRGLSRKAQGQLDKRWKLKRGEPYDALYANRFLKKEAGRILDRAGIRDASVKVKLERNQRERTVSVIITFE